MSNSLLTLQEKLVAGFDVARLREDFPILTRQVHGKALVYLDNGASAQKPKPVLDAMAKAYAETYANVHRGAHFLSGASTIAFEKARASVRRFVNAQKVEEIIFTKGGTEAINLVASCLGATLSEGDEIILTEMEHHSNIVPWHFLRERHGVVLRWAPLNTDDSFDNASHEAHRHNPLCGDRVHLYLKIGPTGLVEDIAFEGKGCAISMASASMMTDLVTFHRFSGHH